MADSILDTITSVTGLGADPAAEAVTEAQKQLVLEADIVLRVSSEKENISRSFTMWISISATAR